MSRENRQIIEENIKNGMTLAESVMDLCDSKEIPYSKIRQLIDKGLFDQLKAELSKHKKNYKKKTNIFEAFIN